jgi:hypothetical protein
MNCNTYDYLEVTGIHTADGAEYVPYKGPVAKIKKQNIILQLLRNCAFQLINAFLK